LKERLVLVRGEPWIVLLVSDIEDRCVSIASGPPSCFETGGCTCYWNVQGQVRNSKLLVASLVDGTQSFELPFEGSTAEYMALAASGTASGSIAIAVSWPAYDAAGNTAGRIDYTLLTPRPSE
jgi:hypothetical protein